MGRTLTFCWGRGYGKNLDVLLGRGGGVWEEP